MLPKLRYQFAERLRADVPRPLEGVVQVSQYKVCEEQQRGCYCNRDCAKCCVSEWIEEKQKQNRRCSERHKKEKRLRHPFCAERQSFVPMSARLVGNVEKPLVHYAFGIVFGFDAGDAGNHFIEQPVGLLGFLTVGERAPFGFYNRASIVLHSSHYGFSNDLFQSVAEK